MNKKKLLQYMIDQLDRDLPELIAAARATYEAATNEESKPENEYDTRGLEASYLAGAQVQRVAEVEELLHIYRHLELKDFKREDKIEATALIEVELNGKRSYVFLMPKGGGQIIQFEGNPVQVITPVSPLGEALLGLKAGDDAVVERGTGLREYEILSVS